MNAAARDINQTNFFHGQLMHLRLSFSSMLPIILMLVVLVSALGVIYTTNYHRLTLSQFASAQQVSRQLQLEWGQLLLEQTSLVNPARLEGLATNQLNMHVPGTKHIIVLRAK